MSGLSRIIKPTKELLGVVMLAGLVGCGGGIEQSESNQESGSTYETEDRPFGLLVGDEVQVKPGEEITLDGRLIGKVPEGIKIKWVQKEGDLFQVEEADITGGELESSNPDNSLTFMAPSAEDMAAAEVLSTTITFEVSAINPDGTLYILEDQPVYDLEGEKIERMVDVEFKGEVTALIFDPALVLTLEAEDETTTLLGNAKIVMEGDDQYITGATGKAMTRDLESESDKVQFNLPKIEKAGRRTLELRYGIGAGYGSKGANVVIAGTDSEGAAIDPQTISVTLVTNGAIDTIKIGTFDFKEGNYTITVGGGWNYYRVDGIDLLPAGAPLVAEGITAPTLAIGEGDAQVIEPLYSASYWTDLDVVDDPETEEVEGPRFVPVTDEVKALMQFFADNYTKKTLTAQQEARWGSLQNEVTTIIENTDPEDRDAPAIVGFDYMDYSLGRRSFLEDEGADTRFTGLTEAQIEKHNTYGFILTASWHWNPPEETITDDWFSGFNIAHTNFDLAATLADPNSEHYQFLLDDMENIANELEKFHEENIPVLWRPLHEAQGNRTWEEYVASDSTPWFWWGAAGPEAFKELWRWMHDYFTETRGLTNLIWVFTAEAHEDIRHWYPGDDYVDIVGADFYDRTAGRHTATHKAGYQELLSMFNGRKFLALTETDVVLDVDKMHEEGVFFSYYMPWFTSGSGDTGLGPENSENIAAKYASNGVINCRDLPQDISPTSCADLPEPETDGGPTSKVVLASFDPESTNSWVQQVDWADSKDPSVSGAWAQDGLGSLSTQVFTEADLGGKGSVILQTFDAVDVPAGATKIRATARVTGVAATATAKLWKKDPDWGDDGAAAVDENGVTLEVTLADGATSVASMGVQFEAFDGDDDITAGQFFIDSLEFIDDDGAVVAAIEGFDTVAMPSGTLKQQVEWADFGTVAVTNSWGGDGTAASLAGNVLATDDIAAANNITLEWQPDGGYMLDSLPDGTKYMLTIYAHATGTGPDTTAKLFYKGADWVWEDDGSIMPLADGGVKLQANFTSLAEGGGDAGQQFNSIGVQFESFDKTSAETQVFIDQIVIEVF